MDLKLASMKMLEPYICARLNCLHCKNYVNQLFSQILNANVNIHTTTNREK